MNYLVYNGFWNPQGAPESASLLLAAAARRGVSLTATPNHDWIVSYCADGVTVTGEQGTIGAGDTVLFWDKDIRLAHAMETAGARVCNSARSIALCDDKLKTHDVLARAGIPMPLTLAAPMTYRSMLPQGCTALWRQAQERLGFPLVVKECFGSLGGQVYMAHDSEELAALTAAMGSRDFLLQKFIAESRGNDKRLYVVGGRLSAAMRRHSDHDFRANIENGGSGTAYQPTDEETKLALRCCALLGLDFGGVDILDSAAGPLVCEVNSNAHMAGLTACTGVDVAGAIIAHVFLQKGNS